MGQVSVLIVLIQMIFKMFLRRVKKRLWLILTRDTSYLKRIALLSAFHLSSSAPRLALCVVHVHALPQPPIF